MERRGFTLVELLVVISLIGMLTYFLLPSFTGGQRASNEAATRARIDLLKAAIDGFELDHAYYPPADFKHEDPKLKVVAKADAINAGIESALIWLHQKRGTYKNLEEHLSDGWLQNTDGDSNGAVIPLLGHSEKLEVVDAWGTPLAYFCGQQAGGYEVRQRIRNADGEEIEARAARDPRSGQPLGIGRYQILSAGFDLQFGTADDLSYPEVAR
jgi:prepilin-type N-terminal cleavage/methylation domain-containing protein